jgi:hypothetical protein
MRYGTRYTDCREATRKPKLIKTALGVLYPTQHVTYCVWFSFTVNIFLIGKKIDNIMPDLLIIVLMINHWSSKSELVNHFFTHTEVLVINILLGT